MNAVIVYASQTGFTKKYAEWLAERTGGEAMEIKEAESKGAEYFDKYDAIVYGGWANTGKVVKSNWFTANMPRWKGKKLAVFCVGASLNGGSHIDDMMSKVLDEEQSKYAKAFYCQGGLSYEKLSLGSRLAMKAYAAIIKRNKTDNEADKKMAELISDSFDVSDPKYLEPIIEYLNK
jgi:flavodoxin